MLKGNHKYLAETLLYHALFLGLGILAVVFFQQRLYTDPGYYSFRLINEQQFIVEHGRTVLALSQVVPLVLVKLGAGLKAVLVGYSLNHIVFNYLLFVLVWFGLKDRAAAVALLLCQTLGYTTGFATQMFEFYYGTALMIFFFSMCRSQVPYWLKLIVGLPVLWVSLTSHAFAFGLLSFLFLFDMLDKRFKTWKPWLPFLLLGAIGLSIELTGMSGYESAKVSYHLNFSENKQYLSLLKPDYLTRLFAFIGRHYAETVLLLLLTAGYLLYRKQYLKTAFVLFSAVGFVLFINAMYNTMSVSPYMQQVNFMLVPLVALPFAYLLLNKAGSLWRGAALLVAVVAIAGRLFIIADAMQLLEAGPETYTRIGAYCRQHYPGNRFLINKANTSHISYFGHHTTPAESMMATALQGRDSTVTLAFDWQYRFENNADTLRDHELFLFRQWEIFPVSYLNSRYFKLNTDEPYTPINTRWHAMDTMDAGAIQQWAEGIALELQAEKHYPAGKKMLIPIDITNTTGAVIPSHTDNGFFMAYHWLQADTVVVWDGQRTPFEVDIYDHYRQPFLLYTPKQPGHYQLELCFIAERKVWIPVRRYAIDIK